MQFSRYTLWGSTGGKGKGMWKKVHWKKDPEQAQENTGRGNARQNIWEVQEEKKVREAE